MKVKNRGKHTASNKTILFHKGIPDEAISQFNTSNKTGRRGLI